MNIHSKTAVHGVLVYKHEENHAVHALRIPARHVSRKVLTFEHISIQINSIRNRMATKLGTLSHMCAAQEKTRDLEQPADFVRQQLLQINTHQASKRRTWGHPPESSRGPLARLEAPSRLVVIVASKPCRIMWMEEGPTWTTHVRNGVP